MPKIIKFLLITDYWLLITFIPLVFGAGEGTTTAMFLQIPQGARGVGMGGAGMAIVQGAEASYYNPAGLVGIKKKELSATYTQWIEGMQAGFIGYAQPFGKTVVGLSVVYLGVEGIEGVAGGADMGAVYGSFAGGSESFAFGVNLKGIYQKYADIDGMGIALDAGVQFKPAKTVAFGVGVQNVGPELKVGDKKDKLPMNIRVGLAIRPFRSLWIVGDVEKPSYRETGFHAGAEYWIGEKFALRAGWQSMDKELGGQAGFTVGAGFKGSWAGAEEEEWFEEEGAPRRKPLKLDLQVDYGLLTFGPELGGETHRVSLGLKF